MSSGQTSGNEVIGRVATERRSGMEGQGRRRQENMEVGLIRSMVGMAWKEAGGEMGGEETGYRKEKNIQHS